MNARRIGLAGLAAVVLAGAALWGWRPTLVPISTRDGPSAMAGRPPVERPAPAPAPPLGAATAIAASGAAAEDPVCVVRRAPAPRDAEASEPGGDTARADAASIPDPLNPARMRLLARLSASADPYANAVAAWLGRDGEDASQTFDARAARLAAMAAGTRDPRLYGLALRMCWRRASHECLGLSARRWSEIDPGNALPWLMLLDEAALHQDVSDMQEALYQASRAPRLAERPYAPLQPLLDAATDDPASLAAARSLALDAIGMAAAQVGPVGFTRCKLATPAEANTWQQCVALKDLLEHRSDTLMARMSGALMTKGLTGDAEPARRVAALMARVTDADIASSSSCADLRGKLALLRRMAVDGEPAVAQALAR